MPRPIPHTHTCPGCESRWRCEKPHCHSDGTCGYCEDSRRDAWLEDHAQNRLRFDEDAPDEAQEHIR
jgi:hypothetical protein